MDYAARHYIHLSGRIFSPGEVIDQPISQAAIARLLQMDALVILEGSDSPIEEAQTTEESDEAIADIDGLDGILPAPASGRATRKGRKKP